MFGAHVVVAEPFGLRGGLAEAQALALRHNDVGTEHLLLGLLGVGDGVAAKVKLVTTPEAERPTLWNGDEKLTPLVTGVADCAAPIRGWL